VRRDRLFRNNVIYFAGGLVAGLLGYVFHFITGRLLGPGGYSLVAAALAVIYILSLPGVAVQIVAARFVGLASGRRDRAGVRAVLRRLNLASLIVGVAVALGLVLVRDQVMGYLRVGDPAVVYVLAGTAIVSLLVTVNRGGLQGERRFLALSGNMVLDMGSRVILAGLLVSFGIGAFGSVMAVFIGPLLAYGQSLLLFRRQPGDDLEAPQEVPSPFEMGRYAVFATLGTGGVIFLFNADVILAKHYLTPSSAGIYAAGSLLGRAVYFLGLTVSTVMFPEVTALHARDEAHFYVVDRSLLILGVIAVGLVATYVLVPGLVLLPYGPGFTAAIPYLAPFAVALSLLAVANLFVSYFLSLDSKRFVVPLLGACALEAVLISAFHSDVGQILEMLLITMACLTTALTGLYLSDRFGPEVGT
jgi:O-antigen/teichoic acid export membrane protein